MRDLIVFATFWNELQWIRASLDQILAIDPVEVIICDGCFDDRHPNQSTDGTREIVEAWVGEQSHRAKLVSATRLRRSEAPGAMLRHLSRRPGWTRPVRWFKSVRQGSFKSLYRINQAVTFGKMIQASEHWRPGRWFMTYDVDQFYPDACLEAFDQCQESSPYHLITARELTFQHDFASCVTGFEKRDWNNMPHRIFSDTVIYPTRHIMRESAFQARLYRKTEPAYDAGTYHHYKFRSGDRETLGYSLGDRKPPKEEKFADPQAYTGPLPSVIQHHFPQP